MLICQEISHWPPIIMLVDPKIAASANHGIDVARVDVLCFVAVIKVADASISCPLIALVIVQHNLVIAVTVLITAWYLSLRADSFRPSPLTPFNESILQ